MRYLPHEVQVKVIKYIPVTDWFKVIGIDFLECGLHEKRLWKEINAEEFGELHERLVLLLKKCAYLTETLRLTSTCWQHERYCLKELLTSFSNLRHVDLSGNTSIENITFLSEQNQLESLKLHQCTSIARVPLLSTVLSFKQLILLDLSECDQIKEKDILRIAKQLKQLKYFNVRDTQSLTAQTVNTVGSRLSGLREFLFCPLVYEQYTVEWVAVYMQHPIMQICPAGLEIILEKNPHLL